MDISKLSPWNWFKKEEKRDEHIPGSSTPTVHHESVGRLHSDIDRLFDDAIRGRFFSHGYFPSLFDTTEKEPLLKPQLDVGGTEKEYLITVELPGVDDKDISVELHDDALIIHGEKKYEHKDEDKEKGYYRMERSYGSFKRILALPEDADAESIQANHTNGVLTIHIARKEPAPSAVKNIEIQSA